MAYGDPVRDVHSLIQSGGLGVPAEITGGTVNRYRVISAGPLLGEVLLDEDPRTNTAGVELPAKPGKIPVIFEETLPLTATDGFKEILNALGSISSATVSGTEEHTATYSATAANTRYFTRQYNVDGRVSHATDCIPTGWRIEAGEGGPFPIVTIRYAGRYACHGEFIPTAVVGPATYNGVIYVTGRANDVDSSQLTYNVRAQAAGTVGDGTTAIETKLSTDGGYGSPTIVYANVPAPIRPQANDPKSGLNIVFTNSGANDDLVVGGTPDEWSVDTRDTVASGTISTGTMFSWNSVEFDLILDDGATFTPTSWFVDFNRNRKTDLWVGGSDAVQKFPQAGPSRVELGFRVLREDARYLNRAWNNTDKSFRIRCQGAEIGSSGLYEAVDITMAQYKAQVNSDTLAVDFLNYDDVTGKAHGSTYLLDDHITYFCRNSVASAVT